MNTDEAYEALSARLGFPGSARLRVVLGDLLAPDEARMVASLPGSPADVALATGLPEPDVASALARLAFEALVRPPGGARRPDSYSFTRSIVELMDSSLGTMRRDIVRDRPLFEHWHDFCLNEMYPSLGRHWASIDRPTTRIVPAYGAVKDLDDVPSHENVRELIKAQSTIAVIPCPCRQRKAAVGDSCAYVEEDAGWHCLSFGPTADSIVQRGAGVHLGVDEALALMDRIEREGLLHTWANTPTAESPISCQCCRDCCVAALPIDTVGGSLTSVWAKSSFEAFVDSERCDGCQDCVTRCHFDAITMVKPASNGHGKPGKKLKAQVDPEKCWGCGLCVVACDEVSAVGFRQVRFAEAVPA